MSDLDVYCRLTNVASDIGKSIAIGELHRCEIDYHMVRLSDICTDISENMHNPAYARLAPMLGRVQDFLNVAEASIGNGNTNDTCNLTVYHD